MIKKFCLILFLFSVIFLFACEKPDKKCEHVDSNNDYICDLCNEKLGEKPEEVVFDMETYLEEFNKREKYLLDYFESSPNANNSSQKLGFSASSVKFKKYEETNDEKYLNQALSQVYNTYVNYQRKGDCFGAVSSVINYGLFNKYYSDELKAFAKKVICETPSYGDSPSTTNHSLMGAVGAYLANQYFPGEVLTPYHGYDIEQDDPTGEKAIREILASYPVNGVYEYNSDTYFVCHFIPLLGLGLLAEDEIIQKKSMMIIENAIFTMAPVYLNGHIAAASERTYMPNGSQNYNGQTNMLLWYYFGKDNDQYPTKEQMDFMETYALGYMIYSSFRPNFISVAMARDRDAEFIHKETHIYNKIRWNTSFVTFMQTKMNKDFAVYSSKTKVFGEFSYTNAYNGYYRQVLNWAVKWNTANQSDRSVFSIQHVSDVDDNRNVKFGTTAYEQVLQYDNTVIGVFNIPKDHKFPNILIYQPDNYKALIDEAYLGRVYVYYENVIIAYCLSEGFIFDIKDNKVRTGITGKAYFVMEAFDPDSIDGDTAEEKLSYVQSMVEGRFKKIESSLNKTVSVKYTNSNGDTLSLKYGGDEQASNEMINGEAVDYNIVNYPIQENPWSIQKNGEDTITYTYKKYKITFDFTKLEIKEEIEEN